MAIKQRPYPRAAGATAILVNSSMRAITMGGKFLIVILLANVLHPAEFGKYALVVTIVGFLVYLVGLEFHTYSARIIASNRSSDRRELYGNSLIFPVMSFAVMLPVSYLILNSNGVGDSHSVSACAILLFELIAAQTNWLLIASNQQLSASLLLLLRSVAWGVAYLLGVQFFEVPRSVDVVLQFWLFFGMATAVVGLVLLPVRPKFRMPNSMSIKWFWVGIKRAMPLLVAILAVRGLFTFDRLAVQHGLGSEVLAAYVFFAGIGNAVMSLVDSSVLVFFYARVVDASARNAKVQLRTMFATMMTRTAAISVILAVLAVVAIQPVLGWLSYEIYLDHQSILYFFLAASVLFCLAITPNHFMFAAGKDRQILLINVLALVTLLVALNMLPGNYGPNDVAVALCASLLVNLVAKSVVAIRGLRDSAFESNA